MTFSAGMPLAIELALFALAVVVLLIGIVGRGGGGPDPRAAESSESVGRVAAKRISRWLGDAFRSARHFRSDVHSS